MTDVDGYQLHEQLHASVRSTVVRATRKNDGARVVIKRVADDSVFAEALRRGQGELELLRSVAGRGIVSALELVRDGTQVALVLADGGESLARRIAARELSLAEAMDVATQLAHGLEQLRVSGVVHRDINPFNVVHDAGSGVVRIIDFDIATRDTTTTAADSLVGTLNYMAPEQTGRLDRPVDHRADLYALGATLFELFTFRKPFTGQDALALVHAHLAVQPPRIDEIDPALPEVLADIVAKLLAKDPTRRYQTARGLAADLERCARSFAEDGRIAPFALDAYDTARFELPERIYGRDAELRALHDAFARASAGGVETVLVAGYSGIGKSSTVRELFPAVSASNGFVAAGKFEQLGRDVPYSALADALGGLVAQVLSADEADLVRWRTCVTTALGADADHAVAVVPRLANLLGCAATPASAVVDPRRIADALSRLVHAFAEPEHPLVLFLDDMQWADVASMQLLSTLAGIEGSAALLLIEAYRDAEVHAAHPYAHLIADREKRGCRTTRIVLAPLTQPDTADLIADALRTTADEIGDIASVIWRKTEGNPFFLRQLLSTLYADNVITFDSVRTRFVVDTARLDSVALADNVADLLARALEKLPSGTAALATIAAAVGSTFDVATVATIAAMDIAAVHRELQPAANTGIVVALDQERYAFGHDRLQAAAYALSTPERRPAMHAMIGRALLDALPEAAILERVFDVVRHLNLGISLITEPAERARLLELELIAATRAHRAGGYDVAASVLEHARELVVWTDYDRCFETHRMLAEMLALAARTDEARAVIAVTFPHATRRDQATLEALAAAIATQVGEQRESIACARRAVALLDHPIPEDPAQLAEAIATEIAKIMAALPTRPVATWVDLPLAEDPLVVAVMELLCSTIPSAYQAEPPLLAYIGARLVSLTLEHGLTPQSPRGCAVFGIVCWTMQQIELACELGDHALAMTTKFPGGWPAVAFSHYSFTAPFRHSPDVVLGGLRDLIPRAYEAGDPIHACYASMFDTVYSCIRGDRLVDQLERAARNLAMTRRFGMSDVADVITWHQWNARVWMGEATDFDADAMERHLEEVNTSPSLLWTFLALRLEQAFWRGDHADVLSRADRMAPMMATVPGHISNGEFRMYACLSALLCDPVGRGEMIDTYRADLARFAATGPANFAHMLALVDAERARLRDDTVEAIRLYDVAGETAAEHAYVKVEVLANERAAEYWTARQKPAFAKVHRAKAREILQHWGALPRARMLDDGIAAKSNSFASRVTQQQVTHAGTNTLDLATVVEASRALSSEVVLSNLLCKFMHLIVENTGAQIGSIVLERDGTYFVHARKQLDRDVEIVQAVPLANAPDVSEGIVLYTMRTNEPVILEDASRHPSFRLDPYTRRRRQRSVLCLPIVSKDRVIGAIYAENNFLAGAFTTDRLAALGILVAQLGISIENAVMFERIAAYRDHLQDLVDERTEQLRAEYAVRQRMEDELRLAQKLQSVGQLAAGVAHEINTPIQFVGNSIEFLGEAFASLVELVDAYQAKTADSEVAARAAELDFEDLRASVPESLSLALGGVQRISKITRALNAFSHPDQLEQAPADLNAAVENSLAVAINEYRHFADVALDLGDLPEVNCHLGEINQVLLNLIVNAAHAIEGRVGHTGQRGEIRIATRLEQDTVLISISDTGDGIPPEIRDRIFDPFFTTKGVGRGTGQGLTLARTAIVDRHEGSLTFETESGRGTTFFIRLPLGGRT